VTSVAIHGMTHVDRYKGEAIARSFPLAPQATPLAFEMSAYVIRSEDNDDSRYFDSLYGRR
jgi:hypothetical protein